MPQYNKSEIGAVAKEYGFVRDTFEKVLRLKEILRFFNEQELLRNHLLLKGGTAINLTVFNLPRLSVDIDMDYIPNDSREDMLMARERISRIIKDYMGLEGYQLSPASRFSHSLDAFHFQYLNTGGKYYEAFYILFHTGMRISEFCGPTIKDIDLENNIINIDHQLQRLSDMTYLVQSTKTNAGTRKLPITEDVAYCFRAILEDRPTPKVEQFVDGYSGFLYLDKDGLPEVALHWEHRFRHAVNRYNEIYRVQMPKITPHICRHTYCSNMAKAGIIPRPYSISWGIRTLVLNTYTHLGLEDAKEEMIRMEELNAARAELNKTTGEKPVTQKMFRAI